MVDVALPRAAQQELSADAEYFAHPQRTDLLDLGIRLVHAGSLSTSWSELSTPQDQVHNVHLELSRAYLSLDHNAPLASVRTTKDLAGMSHRLVESLPPLDTSLLSALPGNLDELANIVASRFRGRLAAADAGDRVALGRVNEDLARVHQWFAGIEAIGRLNGDDLPGPSPELGLDD